VPDAIFLSHGFAVVEVKPRQFLRLRIVRLFVSNPEFGLADYFWDRATLLTLQNRHYFSSGWRMFSSARPHCRQSDGAKGA
jgi:hypothetical protein